MTDLALQQDFLSFRNDGDVEALGRVFDAAAPHLLLLARHLSRFGADGQAEDLVQATFLDALRRASAYDPQRPLMPWLIGILSNHVRNERRKDRRQLDPERLTPPPPEDPADLAEAQEFAEHLAAAIASLPPSFRHVLTLHLVHGLTQTQIAHSMGKPPGTIKSQVHRGLARSRDILPAGLATGLALLVVPSRTLAQVREAVVTKATVEVGAVSTSKAVGWLTWSGLLLGAAALWLAFGSMTGEDPSSEEPTVEPQAQRPLVREPDAAVTSKPANTSPPVRRKNPPAATHRHGLRVQVTAERDGSIEPVEGAWVRIYPQFGTNPALYGHTFRTPAKGSFTVVDVVPDRSYQVMLDRCNGSRSVHVPAEGVAEVTFRLRGRPVRGEVVDGQGKPVAGATVLLSRERQLDDAYRVTTSASQGLSQVACAVRAADQEVAGAAAL